MPDRQGPIVRRSLQVCQIPAIPCIWMFGIFFECRRGAEVLHEHALFTCKAYESGLPAPLRCVDVSTIFYFHTFSWRLD